MYPDFLPEIAPGDFQEIVLSVAPPEDLLPDGAPIVDVEGYAGGELIGAFRKIFRSPVRLHHFADPPFAEREITVHPYPVSASEPTEICVELSNPTDSPHDVSVQFSWAGFGIGIPFTPINGLRSVNLPPESVVKECIHWVPPLDGHLCLQVEMQMEGYPPQFSQRNVDVEERPPCGDTKTYSFTVFNNSSVSATVDIGMITFNLPADLQVSTNASGSVVMEPYGQSTVSVKVMIPCPVTTEAAQSHGLVRAMQAAAGGVPTVDVERYVDGKLVGGIELRFKEKGDEQITIHLPFVSRRQRFFRNSPDSLADTTTRE